MTSNAKDALRKLERRCRDCIALMDATCQQRINDAVAETKAARKECKRLYEAQEITEAEYKAFKREALSVVKQLQARIQALEQENATLERKNAALERKNAAHERERTAWRAGGNIRIIKPNGVKIDGPPGMDSCTVKDEDGTLEATFF